MTKAVCGLLMACCALGCGPRLIAHEDGSDDTTATDTDEDDSTGSGEGEAEGNADTTGEGDTMGDGDGDTKGDGDGDTTGDGDGDTTGDGDGDTTGDAYDPATCKRPSIVTPIPGIEGTTCSAPCMSDLDCPPAFAGAVSVCALVLDMEMLPTQCVLICDPTEPACPMGSSCKELLDQPDVVGVCTYP